MTLLTPVSCLLWDIDGTLIDTTSLIVEALDHVYNLFYRRTLPPDAIRALIGTPLKSQIRVFGEPERFGTSEEAVFTEFIGFYEANRHRERILEEMTELVREGRRRGIPTGLVTSKNREELANTLPRLNIADAVQVAVTADDVPFPKPAPDGILAALTALGISAEQQAYAVYVGDTLHDMQAARQAGVQPAGVGWGAAGLSLLQSCRPALLCATPGELRAALLP